MFRNIGRPEDFKSNNKIRYEQLLIARDGFLTYKKKKSKETSDRVDEHTKLYLKGLGNDPELIECFRALMFNSRELLDALLVNIHHNTNNRTAKDFTKFSRSLMASEYDCFDLKILQFLKTNYSYIFMIRNIRNKLKSDISAFSFVFITDRFETSALLTLNQKDVELVPYLNIEDKEDAIKNKSFIMRIVLDLYFDEMVRFWDCISRLI